MGRLRSLHQEKSVLGRSARHWGLEGEGGCQSCTRRGTVIARVSCKRRAGRAAQLNFLSLGRSPSQNRSVVGRNHILVVEEASEKGFAMDPGYCLLLAPAPVTT